MAAFGADFPVFHEPETPSWLQGMGISKGLLAKELENRRSQIANQIAGVKQKYAEPEAQQALQKAILFNKYYGPEKEAGIANTNASTSHMGAETNKINTLLPMERLAAELGNKQKQYNLDNPEAESQSGKQLHDLVKSGYITPEKAQELAQRIASNILSSQSDFSKLPADYKASYLSVLRRIGLNDQEAAQAAIQGRSLADIAEEHHFARDLSDVPAGPGAPTAATRTRQQRSNVATAEIEQVSPFVDKGLAHYSGQPSIAGTPLGFYKDALTGQNKEAQSDFIAATTLGQDVAFLRANQAGAPLGQALLKHTLETSLMDRKASLPFVTEDVYLDAAKKIKQEFSRINAAGNKASSGNTTNKEKKSDLSRNEKFKREVGDTSKAYSDEDIIYTAKKYGISPEKVRERLNNGSIR